MTRNISDKEIAENLKALYAELLLLPNSEDFLLIIKKGIERLENSSRTHTDERI